MKETKSEIRKDRMVKRVSSPKKTGGAISKRTKKTTSKAAGKTIYSEMSKLKSVYLVVIMIAVISGGVLFVGAVAGWFGDSSKVSLDSEYICGRETCREMKDLTSGEYEKMIDNGKSFVVFVDQPGCTTADRLEEYITRYGEMRGFWFYRMMFGQVRESSMHEKVIFYPSVVVISDGKIVGYLRADSDYDADAYNDYDVFRKWIEEYL